MDNKIPLIEILPVSLSTDELYSPPSIRFERRCDSDDGMLTACDLSAVSVALSRDTVSAVSMSDLSASFLVVSSSSATSTNSRLHIYTFSQASHYVLIITTTTTITRTKIIWHKAESLWQVQPTPRLYSPGGSIGLTVWCDLPSYALAGGSTPKSPLPLGRRDSPKVSHLTQNYVHLCTRSN